MSLRPPVWFLFSVALLGLLAVVVTLQGNRLDDRDARIAADAATRWHSIRQEGNGKAEATFVFIDRGSESNRAVYDSAVQTLCWGNHRRGNCPIVFLTQGSPIPAKVFPALAFSGLAFSAGEENLYTSRPKYLYWDCDEAGAQDAPEEANCRTWRPRSSM